MAELVEGMVNVRRHGDTLYMPVANSTLRLIKILVNARTRAPTCPKDLGGVGNYSSSECIVGPTSVLRKESKVLKRP